MLAQAETFEFQAQTTRLLDLMINSLYTNKEIFLRELISNASDALDRLRFEAITRPELLAGDESLEIRLDVDRTRRTLTIHDSGIGMSREEVIDHIGVIAKSGTRELRERLGQEPTGATAAELIGQFGVGFYSAFMVADRVALVTRRAGEESAVRWESTGNGQYTISEATKARRGTSITLDLKPADPENGIEDYTDKWVLARVVKRYSDFINFPIIFQDQREEEAGAESDNSSAKTIVVEDKVLNSMKPLWNRPRAEVTDGEYVEFYKQLTHDYEPPLKSLALQAEGSIEYKALVYVPSKAPRDLFYHAGEHGLRLYAKGVSIIERCGELLPKYLRFIRGVVDSADLPLNISRQMLQQDRHITQMRKWLTKKLLDALEGMYANEPELYGKFWEQFGRALKEGVSADFDNRDRITNLLLFASSHDQEALTTLKDYVARMPEGQQDIFYLTGESRSVVENSPHLEAVREQGYEVLYLTDPVDELLVQALTEFEGRRLKSVGKGFVKLGGDEGSEAEKELEERAEGAAEFLEFLQQKLDQHVKQVRLSNRLRTSPVCLVGAEHDYSPQMERLLLMGKGAGPKQRRIMELNPQHELFEKMLGRFRGDRDDPVIGNYAELLLGYGLLAEGSELHDPVRFVRLLAEVMAQSI